MGVGTDKYHFFYNPKTISYSYHIIKFEWRGVDQLGYEYLGSHEVDCARSEFRTFNRSCYDKHYRSVGQLPDEPWQSIPPNSLLDVFKKRYCRSKTMNQIDLTDLSSLPRLWEGSWESKKNLTRSGSIRVNIIDIRENGLNGTIALYNSVCPSVSQFRGEVKNGKLIIFADLGPPCGEMKAEAEPHDDGLQGLY